VGTCVVYTVHSTGADWREIGETIRVTDAAFEHCAASPVGLLAFFAFTFTEMTKQVHRNRDRLPFAKLKRAYLVFKETVAGDYQLLVFRVLNPHFPLIHALKPICNRKVDHPQWVTRGSDSSLRATKGK
jgi:hypothetical protein